MPEKPARYAARPTATAASSCARRLPISMSGRPSAAMVMRAAAEAMAVSWLKIESASVSRRMHSPRRPLMVRTGECGQ